MSDLTLFAKGESAAGNKSTELANIAKRNQLDKYAGPARPINEEIVFMVDATGSMIRIWKKAKEDIKKLTKRLHELGFKKISFVAYRDYIDENRVIDFLEATTDIKTIENFIDQISCFGGDDFPEAVELALERMEETKASLGILLGDAPPHGVVDKIVNGKDFRMIAKRLKEKNISIYTVYTAPHQDTISAFKEIADITDGKYFFLDQIDDLIDILSVAAAKKTNQIARLAKMIAEEQGGRLTQKQKMLLT